MIQIRQRKVAVTTDGQPIWTNGYCKYWTGDQILVTKCTTSTGRVYDGKTDGRPAQQTLYTREWDQSYLDKMAAKIESQIGQPVQWVDGEPVETIAI